MAPSFVGRFGGTPAGFLIFPTWSIEDRHTARAIGRAFRKRRREHPEHKIRYLCNSAREADILQEFGVPAIFLNHKIMVSEQVFRPLPGATVDFDAVYNARFVLGKRHALTADVEKVAYLTYVEDQELAREEFWKLWPEIQARSPEHALLNDMKDGLPVRMPHVDVNRALSRASTGLILSKIEGASYAAMEYMLAGLPVVSTPSVGGRDVFFDPEYCLICEPTPSGVRDAVDALKARSIPRDYIRERTLKTIERDRQRFLGLMDAFLEELGASRSEPSRWSFGDVTGVPWDPFERHLAAFERVQAKALAADVGVALDDLAQIQMTANELRPIVNALRAKPGGSLLVFGCGNDSAFWETANRGGVTAFLEDDPIWIDQVQPALQASTVHPVRYDTVQKDWRRLLGRPTDLAMTLPETITSRGWDVIVVDGPAGYQGAHPGRMQSIYAASRLVAPGGQVFVHDCDRPAEAAFADRYLGPKRLFVEAKGRALLRGYAF